jgi:hypothetical protein
MKLYTLKSCEDLIRDWTSKDGQVTVLEEGILGLGQVVLHGLNGHKIVIITETYLNAWSSGHKVRMYNSMPAKYQKLIDKL